MELGGIERASTSTPEVAAKRLDSALQEGDMNEFMRELARAIRARGGYTAAAAAAGINRTSLYKSVSATGNPSLSTLLPLLLHLGLRLSVQAPWQAEQGVVKVTLSARAESEQPCSQSREL